MKKAYLYLAFACCALLLAAPGVFANIWIDETFEDFNDFGPQNNGANVRPADGLDVYSFNPVTNPTTITHDGAGTLERAFNGVRSYRMDAGQSVSMGLPIQDSAGGPMVYLQFAVSVDSIPTTPGNMARLDWTYYFNTVQNNLFVSLDSNGTSVDITAGESLDSASSALIDNIPDNQTWKFITLQVNKNIASVSDSRTAAQPFSIDVPTGINFFSSSQTPGHTVVRTSIEDIGPPPSERTEGFTFVCNAGTVFLDDVYFENGMTDTLDGLGFVPAGIEALRPFDTTGTPFFQQTSSSVGKWNLYR